MAFVTFIHGIANKPEKEALRRIWLRVLREEGGVDLEKKGVGSQMVYWADLLYAEPVAVDPSIEEEADSVSTVEGAEAAGVVEPDWLAGAPRSERAFVMKIAAEVMAKAEAAEVANPKMTARPRLDGTTVDDVALERIPLPWFVKEPLMRVLLRDVHHYLFNVTMKSPSNGKTYEIRTEIRRRFVAAMKRVKKSDGPHLVVSHSMGTVIAYDCLKRVGDCPPAASLMTIGSPLGLDEVQDKLHAENGGPGWTRSDGFPSATIAGEWVNVYDRLDPVVGFDPQFANDYRRKRQRAVIDVNEQNWGRWRHDITKYLHGKRLRTNLRKLLQID